MRERKRQNELPCEPDQPGHKDDQPSGTSQAPEIAPGDPTVSENSTGLIQRLQTSEEELRAANEELHAANEELAAAEEELRVQNAELSVANEDAGRERARYSNLFESAPDGYVVTDAEGTIKVCNRAAALMLGQTAEDLNRRKLSFFLFATGIEQYVKHLSDMTAYGSPVPTCEVKIHPVGRLPFWAAITASRGQSDGRFSIRWLIRDITERKRAEEALQEINANLAACGGTDCRNDRSG